VANTGYRLYKMAKVLIYRRLFIDKIKIITIKMYIVMFYPHSYRPLVNVGYEGKLDNISSVLKYIDDRSV